MTFLTAAWVNRSCWADPFLSFLLLLFPGCFHQRFCAANNLPIIVSIAYDGEPVMQKGTKMEFAALIGIGIVMLWMVDRSIVEPNKEFASLHSDANERVAIEIEGHLEEIFDLVGSFAERNGSASAMSGGYDRDKIVGYVRFDLYRLLAYLVSWHGDASSETLARMKEILGCEIAEEEVRSIREEMEGEMENPGYIFSPLCFRISRVEPDTARRYLEKLIEIGRIFLWETGETNARIALDYFALIGRISIQSHNRVNRRIALTEPVTPSA
jgi:hypothetical protein